MIKETDYDWDREGEEVMDAIASAADIGEEPAEDIRLNLEERHFDHERDKMGEEGPFDKSAHYTEKATDDIEFQIEWAAFERGMKMEARFFSRAAQSTLSVIFEGLTGLQTREGRPAIVDAGPGRELIGLYRARVFQSDVKLEEALKRPDLEIGPPPFIAAAAGRMNARGIWVFYGATSADAALAEVRPPVGSRVVVGRFEIIRPIRLLDVEALREVYVKGSIFDGGHIRQLERAKFLESLSRRMTLPVMPDDEPFEYLVTQAIADYLATEANLDGMIYPSAQLGDANANVVLFHRASSVEPFRLAEGSEVSVQLDHQTEDGPEIDYRVWEKVPLEAPSPPALETPQGPLEIPNVNWDEEPYRPPVLRLDLASLQVHHVSNVKVIAKVHPVSRHRLSKTKDPA